MAFANVHKFVLTLLVIGLIVTISDVGAVAQAVHPDWPIWALVAIAEVCVIVLAYRNWNSRPSA